MTTIQQLTNFMQKYPEAVKAYAEDSGNVDEIREVTKTGKGAEALLNKLWIGIALHSPIVLILRELKRRGYNGVTFDTPQPEQVQKIDLIKN